MSLSRLRWITIVVGVSSVAACYVCLVSCSSSPRAGYRVRLADTGAPALHAVHDARLRAVMADLNSLAVDKLPQELDAEAERDRNLDRAAKMAVAIADTATDITNFPASADFSEQERAMFVNLAKKLETEARQIAQLTQERSVSRLEEGLDRLAATCDACHSAFRLQPVERGAP